MKGADSMHFSRGTRPSQMLFIPISAFVLLAATATASADATVGPPIQILPAAGASQSFTISTHLTGGSGPHPHGSANAGMPTDESGTMVVKRTDLADAEVTLAGVADAGDASHAVVGSAIDAGSPPESYILAFDNAAAIAAGASADPKLNDAWTASLQTSDPTGAMFPVTVNATVTSISGGTVQIHAIAKTTQTFTTSHGTRTADVTVDVTETIAGSVLVRCDQSVSRGIHTPIGTYSFGVTTTLKSP